MKKLFRFLKETHTLYIALTMLLVLNIAISASVAWLTINRRTDADGMGMGLTVDDTSAVYEAYMYDIKAGKGTDTGENGEALNVTNLNLNQYDTIFRAQNKYTPAFARITIVRNKSMPKSGTVHLTIERSETDESEELSAFTSSIIRFTAFLLPDKSDLDVTDPETLYDLISTKERFNAAESYQTNTDESKTFVTVNGEGEDHTHEKSLSITVSADYTEDNWYKNADGYEAINVYLYITYDVQLIKFYMDENSSGSISLDDNSVFFENDLKKVTASYTEN